nr:MAG TPA: hypothetical protein [Caudoviricetes sp.]
MPRPACDPGSLETTLARDQKRNLSLRRPSFWAKN